MAIIWDDLQLCKSWSNICHPTGCERNDAQANFYAKQHRVQSSELIRAKQHRSCVDGRATARHLHGKMERAVRCFTVKVSAESADAVSR